VRIPIIVVENDGIGRSQIDAQSAATRGDQKDNDGGLMERERENGKGDSELTNKVAAASKSHGVEESATPPGTKRTSDPNLSISSCRVAVSVEPSRRQ
jgi:hypothetical protein